MNLFIDHAHRMKKFKKEKGKKFNKKGLERKGKKRQTRTKQSFLRTNINIKKKKKTLSPNPQAVEQTPHNHIQSPVTV